MNRRALLLAPLSLVACSSPPPPPPVAPAAPPKPRGPVFSFSLESLDARPVSQDAFKGRACLLIFIATYGNDSLILARNARKVFLEHSPRINAAAIFLEPIENRPLARVFRDSTDLPFPSAIGDADAIAGRGAFDGLGAVPSILVLDHEGREVWRKLGGAAPDELHQALREAQRGVWSR